jgi:peptide-methionine (S)-S-oxide reductase
MSSLATFAGGCFWGVEAAFRQVPGVVRTTAGYTGGTVADPTYEQVCTGTTGHAEAVEVEFDAKRVSYDELLGHFWQLHDPTQMNRQGPDVGRQYRSSIFYHTPEQQAAAQASKQALAASGKFKEPVVTEIVAAGPFYPAEDYHQQYLEKRGQSTCTPELAT